MSRSVEYDTFGFVASHFVFFFQNPYALEMNGDWTRLNRRTTQLAFNDAAAVRRAYLTASSATIDCIPRQHLPDRGVRPTHAEDLRRVEMLISSYGTTDDGG